MTLGAFIGVHDTSDPGEARKTKLFEAINTRIPNLREGSAVLQRHGMVGLPTPLGDETSRTGQLIFQHRRLDGTIDRLSFGGGRLYRWDGTVGASAFTDITPAGVTIHPSNPVFAATLNAEIIFSDENYNPWVFNPAAGTADLINIDTIGTDWASKGGPEIRSAKVVFIVKRQGSSEITMEDDDPILMDDDDDELMTELLIGVQNTIVWSEEGDPRTGYIQDGFDNALTLTQTSDEVLGGIKSEEAALIYFRNKGIGYITGEITDDFKASHTKDTASTTSGSDSPAAMISIKKRVWFLDMDGRVCRLLAGGGEPEQLFYPMRRELEGHVGTSANRTSVVRYARAAYHEGYNLVLFTIWDRQTIYAFDADTGKFVGIWVVGGDEGESVHIDAMGSMLDSNSRATFLILGTRSSDYDTAAQGVLWKEKHPDDAMQWLDQPDASVASYVALTRVAETQWISSNAATSYRAIEVSAQVVGDVDRHAVGLEYTTPSGGRSARLVAQSSRTVGVKSNADAVATVGWTLGRNAQGGALRFRLSATHADNVCWGVHNIAVTAIVTKSRPNAR